MVITEVSEARCNMYVWSIDFLNQLFICFYTFIADDYSKKNRIIFLIYNYIVGLNGFNMINTKILRLHFKSKHFLR